MTKELEKKYYGSDPIFIYDPKEMKNRPIPGTDHNLKLFWNIYPQYIRNLFVRAFSQEVMMKQKPRILEKEWLDAFFKLRAETGKCPYCKNEMFYTAEGVNECFECKKQITKPAKLMFKNYNLPIYAGMKIYLWHIDSTLEDIETVVGEIVTNPQNPKMLGLRNLSSSTWKISTTDGEQKPLSPGNVVPIRDGFTVDFIGNNQSVATMKLQ